MARADDSTGAGGLRGKRMRGEDRAAALLDAAFDVFTEHGYAAARMEDVAARAGVTKAAIYLYYDSKMALFEATVRAVIAPKVEKLEAAATAARKDPEAAIMAMIDVMYTEFAGTKRRRILSLMVAEGRQFPELARFYRAAVTDRAIAAAHALLEEAARQGLSPPPKPETPLVLAGPVLLGAIWKLVFDPDAPLDLDALRAEHKRIVRMWLRVGSDA